MIQKLEITSFLMVMGLVFGGSLLERKHPNEPLKIRSVFNIVPDFEPPCDLFSFWRQSGFSLAQEIAILVALLFTS
jgi:predicted permease